MGDWSWDGSTFALMLDAGVRDPAGHAAGAFNTMFNWLPLGQPVPSVEFASPIPGVWGNVKFQQACPPGAACTTQISCESGGCAVMGPFDNTVCGGPRMGIAGRLVKGANLVVRYRVLVGADYPGASGPPSWGGTPFSVDIATPGSAATYHSVNVDSGEYHALPSPIGSLQWATDFRTLTLPVSAASEVGFAVFAGLGPGDCGGGGPVPAPVPTAVIIDSISTH